MVISSTKSIFVFFLLLMLQFFVFGRHQSLDHQHNRHDFRHEIMTKNLTGFRNEGRRLVSDEIHAWMKSQMKAGHVEVRCQGLRQGVLVKDFDYVVLKPGEDHIWSAEQIDLSPDRVICILFWKKLYLINDIYYYDHSDPMESEWTIDEHGLNRMYYLGASLVQKWREPRV